MSWKAIVSGTTFDALTVCPTASSRVSATGTTATLGSIVDRREWIVGCLRGHAGQGAEQRRLAGVRYANDPDLHRRALVTRAGQEACSTVRENVVGQAERDETCQREQRSALSCRDPAGWHAPGMYASSAQAARPKTSLIESAGRPILQIGRPGGLPHVATTQSAYGNLPAFMPYFRDAICDTSTTRTRHIFFYNLRRFGVREPG